MNFKDILTCGRQVTWSLASRGSDNLRFQNHLRVLSSSIALDLDGRTDFTAIQPVQIHRTPHLA